MKSVTKRIHDVVKARAMEWKRFYCEQQRVAWNAMLQQIRVLHNAKELVLRRDVKKAAQTICQTISFQLVVFPRSAAREAAMQKVL